MQITSIPATLSLFRLSCQACQALIVIALIVATLSGAASVKAKSEEHERSDAALSLEEAFAAYATMHELELAASTNGRFLTWSDGRDIHVATEPDFGVKTVTAHEDDSRIRAVFPSTDGSSIFYVRGEYDAAFGPYPARDTRELWRVDLNGAPPMRLATGDLVPVGDVTFAPDGASFLAVHGAVLYRYDGIRSENIVRQPVLERADQHLAATAIWDITYSPDGSRIAFVSKREAGQSYIGVHDFNTQRSQYLHPSIYRDQAPTWSPDGDRVAFARVPGNWTREYRFTDVRQGVPWQLVVADLNDGRLEEVWRAERGAGSVAWYSPYLFWTDDDRLIFPWEGSGWQSLYAVPISGGEVVALTPGAGDVRGRPVVSGDGQQLFFVSTAGDLPRQHLWRLALNSGEIEQLTSGDGFEGYPVPTAGGYLGYVMNESGRMPTRRVVASPQGQIVAELTPSAAENAQWGPLWESFAAVQTVPVMADDGITSYHLLRVPDSEPPDKGFPVIVTSKGGPDGRVIPGLSHRYFAPLGEYAVSRGYLVVEINYRGGTGFGLDYRLPDGRGATGGSEVKDLKALVRYLKDRPDVNPERIAIVGHSYGGHIVNLAMSRMPEDFRSAVHMSGVADWVIEMKKDQQEGWPSKPPHFIRLSERVAIEDLAFASSPTAQIERWRAPVLFTMGELDSSGHMESLIDLGNRLQAQGVSVEFYVAPGAGHEPSLAPPRRVFEFLERTLCDGPQCSEDAQ